MKKSEMILNELGNTDEKYLNTKAPRKKGFIAVIAAAAVLAVLMIALPVISKTSSPSILPPETAATAAQNEKSSAAEKETGPQPETDAADTDRTGFDYTPGVILPPVKGSGIQGGSGDSMDRYGYPFRYDKYYDRHWFEPQNKDSDTKTVAGAFCLVKVNGVKTVDATAKMHELDPTLNPEFTYYETTAEIEIEKVMRATDNVSKSRIKEGETIDTRVMFQFVYDGDGKLINNISISFPVIEIGSEYIVYLLNSFGESKSTLMLVITVPINDAVIDEDYLKYYADNYPIGENAYKLNIKYLNEFLYDYLSDPRMPERFEDPIFETYYPID